MSASKDVKRPSVDLYLSILEQEQKYGLCSIYQENDTRLTKTGRKGASVVMGTNAKYL